MQIKIYIYICIFFLRRKIRAVKWCEDRNESGLSISSKKKIEIKRNDWQSVKSLKM